MSKRQNFLYSISNPHVAYILLMLGIAGLIFEFTHPGIGFPGIAGFISLLLAFLALDTLPVNYVGIIFIFLGIILLIAELYTPTFGILTLGSTICLGIGSTILMKSPLMQISFHLIAAVLIINLIIGSFLAYLG